ncbi:hypothetical protein LCGC14_3107160, partial [marine sediment metagenome]
MTMKTLLGVLALAVVALSPAQGAPPAGRVILDETAYCRAYHQFGWDRIDAGVLKAEGEKILGPTRLKKLRREVKRLHKGHNIDWSKTDWRDHAVFRLVTISHSLEGSVDRLNASRTPPPPPDWQRPGFD